MCKQKGNCLHSTSWDQKNSFFDEGRQKQVFVSHKPGGLNRKDMQPKCTVGNSLEKRHRVIFKFRYYFLFNCMKFSNLEGTVHLFPKATTYCFVLQHFVLADKAKNRSHIWLRSKLC